jgi:hypothetical protein
VSVKGLSPDVLALLGGLADCPSGNARSAMVKLSTD